MAVARLGPRCSRSRRTTGCAGRCRLRRGQGRCCRHVTRKKPSSQQSVDGDGSTLGDGSAAGDGSATGSLQQEPPQDWLRGSLYKAALPGQVLSPVTRKKPPSQQSAVCGGAPGSEQQTLLASHKRLRSSM